jgi:hypothetical protein
MLDQQRDDDLVGAAGVSAATPGGLAFLGGLALAVFGFTLGAALLGFLFGVTGGFAPLRRAPDAAQVTWNVPESQAPDPDDLGDFRRPLLSRALTVRRAPAPPPVEAAEALDGAPADEALLDSQPSETLEAAAPAASQDQPPRDAELEEEPLCGIPPCP